MIANPFVLEPTGTVLVHAGLLLSGAVTALGVDPAIWYLLWKPVAVVVLFVAAHRVRPAHHQRRVASTCVARRRTLLPGAGGDDHRSRSRRRGLRPAPHPRHYNALWTVWALWGLPFTAITIRLATDAPCLRACPDRLRVGPVAAGVALLCAWLQPWQGATLLTILVATELLRRADGERRMHVLVATVVAGKRSLLYYFVLGQVDDSWRLAGEINLGSELPTWMFAAAFAIDSARRLLSSSVPPGSRTFAVRVWPVAALGQYCVLQIGQIGTFPLHAIEGLAFPFGTLAVIGVRHAFRDVPAQRRRVVLTIGTVLIVLLLVPSTIWRLGDDRDHVLSGETPSPFFLRRGERARESLREQPGEGGVLSEIYLGVLVPGGPAATRGSARFSWTPDFFDAPPPRPDLLGHRRA